jgi:hypothetical protein
MDPARVAQMVPAEARAVARLHEAFESSPVSEQDLLMEDLTWDELRALRLLVRRNDARSDGIYYADGLALLVDRSVDALNGARPAARGWAAPV